MPDIRLIAAIGKRGQLGLDGKLPWGKEIGDLPWFKSQTLGHIILMGRRTYDSVGPLPDREVGYWAGEGDPAALLKGMLRRQPHRIVFIAGGSHTYAAFAPFCTKFLITRVDCDGPADAWFNPACLLAPSAECKSLEPGCLSPASGETLLAQTNAQPVP